MCVDEELVNKDVGYWTAKKFCVGGMKSGSLKSHLVEIIGTRLWRERGA